MPTNITFVPRRKPTSKPKILNDMFTDLTTVCFWAIVALVLVTLLINSPMDPELVATMVIPG
jgi:hypothetical protein